MARSYASFGLTAVREALIEQAGQRHVARMPSAVRCQSIW